MDTYLLRLWLPDRPGALGAVASRIGAVKGDVIGIEILETGDGQAIDELVVQVPEATLVDLLVSEVREVDGVHVEDVRPIGSAAHDPVGATLDVVARLVEATSRDALLDAIRDHLPASVSAEWVALVDTTGGQTLVAGAGAPRADWLVAFALGAATAADLGGSGAGSSDVVWSPMADLGLALVAGRDGIVWRERGRHQLDVAARIIAARWTAIDGY